MREIQIICVNDGSTDGSSAILEEYVVKDPRIEVHHQENQGGGSARNAAYPYIRGKYTYFVDPDDWIELDLCQQCWDKAEATEADMVIFRFTRQHTGYSTRPDQSPIFDPMFPEVRQSPKEKYNAFSACTAWLRFWRSDFLLSNDIRFAEGKRPYNDNFAIWKGFVLAKRISVLNNILYHQRIRPGSYQYAGDERHFIVVEVNNEREQWLRETGHFETYKEFFCARKCVEYYYSYGKLLPSLRPEFLKHIRQYWTEEDRKFYRTASKELLLNHIRRFCEMIDGGSMAMANYYVALVMYYVTKAIKMPKRLLVQKIIHRVKGRLGRNGKK